MPIQLLLVTCSFLLLFISSFFDSPLCQPQPANLPLITYLSLWSTCATCRAPCYPVGHQMLLIQAFHRQFPLGRHPSRACFCVSVNTYLACLQSPINISRLVFNHVKIKNVLLVVKSLIKSSSHINQQPWINSHFT